MQIGYARVSSTDQILDLQLDALNKVGCGRIFTDVASGAKSERIGLKQALEFARSGDTLVVWKLDRLGRSLKDLIGVVTLLETRGIGFKSLNESIDTTTAAGKLFFHVFGALAEFERSLILERTRAGMVAARARGKVGGRPKLMDEKLTQVARTLHANPDIPITQICRRLGVSRATLYRSLELEKNLP
jgi:DNA invertase Pin-like site-specific DNA recombinase